MATTIIIPTPVHLMAITGQTTLWTVSSSAQAHGSMATTGVAFTIADIMATEFTEAVRMATDTDSTVAQVMATPEDVVTAIAPNLMADGDMGAPEEVITAGAAFTEVVAITDSATSTAEVDS